MGRKATGSVVERGGVRYAVVSVPTGKLDAKGKPIRKREWVKLDPDKVKTDAKATRVAAVVSEGLRSGKLVREKRAWRRESEPEPEGPPPLPPPAAETLRAWSERWVDARKARSITSAKDDLSRLRTHVWPLLGELPMATITADDIERLVQYLDGRIHAGTLSWKTARNVWGVVTRMFVDARRSKDRTLRVRTDNPAADLAPPDEGVRKSKVYLYPSEVSRLLHCDRVPVRWRRLVALAVYLYVRAGELEALRCEDIDIAHGVVHVHESIDRYRNIGERKSTKSKASRRFHFEPELAPLLRVLAEEAGGKGPLVKMPPAEDLAERLRQYLEWARVERSELFAPVGDRTRKRITWHDLRATGLTWCAVRGDEPLAIQHRAGHSDLATTQVYIREAEAVARSFGTVFEPLPRAIL